MLRAIYGPIIKTFVFLSLLTPSISYAYYTVYNQEPNRYYGEQFYQAVNQGLSNEDLKNYLNFVLKSGHITMDNGYDQFVEDCSQTSSGSCYHHTYYTYREARKILMGQLHLAEWNNHYVIKCVYCEKYYGPDEFPGSSRPGPGQIPNHTVLNAEHTWPQSRFSHRYPEALQKSDLHHLYPTDSRANSTRGNHPFGMVTVETESTCGHFKVGYVDGQSGIFAEPPDAHKGNVARALMYFSVRYEMDIDPYQEAVIRVWHQQDPVDVDEINRHEAIFNIQGDRNPFIDHPELAQLIDDF